MPTVSDILAPVREADRIVHSPGGWLTDIENVLNGTGAAIGEDAAAGVVGPEADAALAAGAAVGDISILGVVGLAVGVLLVLRWIEYGLIRLIQILPLPIGKTGMIHFLENQFQTLDGLFNALAAILTFVIQRTLRQLVSLVRYAVNIPGVLPPFFVSTGPGPPIVTTPDLTQIHLHISQLEQWNYSLQRQVDALNAKVFGATTPVTGISVTLEEQVQDVQGQINTLQGRVTHLDTLTEAQGDTLSTVQTQLQRLLQQLHGLRAVELGWADVQQQLEQIIFDIEQRQAIELSLIQSNTSRITQLEPLALLLQPGPKGLQNLRTLEDDMCQCPKFNGIPNELGTALAIMEFIENG